jgi:hypothetical protein
MLVHELRRQRAQSHVSIFPQLVANTDFSTPRTIENLTRHGTFGLGGVSAMNKAPFIEIHHNSSQLETISIASLGEPSRKPLILSGLLNENDGFNGLIVKKPLIDERFSPDVRQPWVRFAFDVQNRLDTLIRRQLALLVNFLLYSVVGPAVPPVFPHSADSRGRAWRPCLIVRIPDSL